MPAVRGILRVRRPRRLLSSAAPAAAAVRPFDGISCRQMLLSTRIREKATRPVRETAGIAAFGPPEDSDRRATRNANPPPAGVRHARTDAGEHEFPAVRATRPGYGNARLRTAAADRRHGADRRSAAGVKSLQKRPPLRARKRPRPSGETAGSRSPLMASSFRVRQPALRAIRDRHQEEPFTVAVAIGHAHDHVIRVRRPSHTPHETAKHHSVPGSSRRPPSAPRLRTAGRRKGQAPPSHWSRKNAIRRPSGDHSGPYSAELPEVNSIGSPAPTSLMYM